MPIELSNMAADVVPVVVYWGEDECKVSYRPSAITTRRVEQLQAAEDDSDAFLDFITAVLASWDVTSGGEVVPITVDALKDVPLPFIRAIVITIMEDSGRGDSGKV